MPLELVEQLLIRCAQDVMDLVHLIEFIVPRKQREERNDLEYDAADAPQVHLVPIIAISEEALRCTIPPRRDILCVGLLRIDATTTTKVGQFDLVFHQQYVLWFDVTMENAVTVHVIDSLHQLVHVVLDAFLGQVVPAALDRIVHVHLHELEYEGQTACRFIVQHFIKLDNLRMR